MPDSPDACKCAWVSEHAVQSGTRLRCMYTESTPSWFPVKSRVCPSVSRKRNGRNSGVYTEQAHAEPSSKRWGCSRFCPPGQKRPIVVRYRISERRPVAKSCGYRVQRPIRGSGSNDVSVQRVQSAGPYASADDPGLLLVRESIGEQSGGKLPRASGTDSPTRSPVRSGTPPKGEFGAGSRKRDKRTGRAYMIQQVW